LLKEPNNENSGEGADRAKKNSSPLKVTKIKRLIRDMTNSPVAPNNPSSAMS